MHLEGAEVLELAKADEADNSDDRRMDGCFLQAKVDTESGRSAAPRTSRAHMHVMTHSLGPQANVCGDLCYACAFISHVWSSFRGCQASKRFSA
jgi:hypothetical protein